MGFLKNMKRVNSADYIGTCRYEGQPSVCEFVNIENGNIVIWANKGEDKVFSNTDFADVKVIAYIVLQTGLNLVIGATVKGKKMAFQLEYTHLSTAISSSILSNQETLNSMVGNGNRASRIQKFLDTIGSPIRARATDWANIKKIVMPNNVKIEDSYEMIMSSFTD